MNDPAPSGSLVGLASRLARVHSVAEVVETTLAYASVALGADACVLAIPTEAGRRLHLLSRPSDAEIVGDTPRIHLAEGTPIAKAIRTGKPVVVHSAGQMHATQAQEDGGIPGRATVLAVPLEAMTGVTGGIGFGWTDHHVISSQEEEEATTVAQWIGVSLERALSREREHRFVQAIRGELMRSIDLAPDVDVVGMYRPPWSGMPLGGDWYDAVRLDDGRILLIVGDVAGHGIDVTPAMLSVRGYLRAIADQDADPVSCLARLDATMRRYEGDGGTLASVIVATLDTGTGELLWANGGLPPPILRRADGATSILIGRRSRLVGTGMRRRSFEPATTKMRPGDLIVFYSDGLFASMGTSTVRAEDMRDTIREGGAGELVDLCRSLMGLTEHSDLRTDDATVLAVRVR